MINVCWESPDANLARHTLPVMFALLPDKKGATYKKCFEMVRNYFKLFDIFDKKSLQKIKSVTRNNCEKF